MLKLLLTLCVFLGLSCPGAESWEDQNQRRASAIRSNSIVKETQHYLGRRGNIQNPQDNSPHYPRESWDDGSDPNDWDDSNSCGSSSRSSEEWKSPLEAHKQIRSRSRFNMFQSQPSCTCKTVMGGCAVDVQPPTGYWCDCTYSDRYFSCSGTAERCEDENNCPPAALPEILNGEGSSSSSSGE